MGFADWFSGPNINEEIEKYKATPGAILLDVRSVEEYKRGYIPGSIHIPVQSLENIHSIAENKDTPLFVYCHSGSRSGRAVRILQKEGYINARNIGGIISYKGEIEKHEK